MPSGQVMSALILVVEIQEYARLLDDKHLTPQAEQPVQRLNIQLLKFSTDPSQHRKLAAPSNEAAHVLETLGRNRFRARLELEHLD